VTPRRQIPRPRHLFPETAAFFIGLRRTLLYFGFGSRTMIGRIPVWIAGSVAGVASIMLTISLFFGVREQAQAAPLVQTPVSLPTPIPYSPPTPVMNVPEPEPRFAPEPVSQRAPKLAMTFDRTNFLLFPFDELAESTRSSFDQRISIPTVTTADLWRQALQRIATPRSFASWTDVARPFPTNWTGLVASNQVPLQLAPDADRDLGLMIQKTPAGRGTPGEPVQYDIVLINTSFKTIEQVIIREMISDLHQVTEVSPSAHLDNNELVWTVTSLEPGTVKRLSVTLVPETAGEIFTETIVLPTTRLSKAVNVLAPRTPTPQPVPAVTPVEVPQQGEPLLKLTYTPLRALKQGEILSMTFAVTNIGTAPAEDVQLFVRLSGEFEHRYGEYVHHRAGRLAPGQTRRALLQATARSIGDARLSTSLTMRGVETEARDLKIPISPAPRTGENSPNGSRVAGR